MQIDAKWVMGIIATIMISLISWLGSSYLQTIVDTQIEIKTDVKSALKSIHQIEIDLTKKSGNIESLNSKIESVEEDVEHIMERIEE